MECTDRNTGSCLLDKLIMTTVLLAMWRQTAPTRRADEGEAGHAFGRRRGQAAGDHATHGVPHHVRLGPAHVVLQGAAEGVTCNVG